MLHFLKLPFAVLEIQILGHISTFCIFRMHVLKNCSFLDILLKVKTYRFADIAIILHENLVEIPQK
jgi:hypothetical protein